MNKFLVPIVATLALFLGSCRLAGIRGNGDITTDRRTVEEFREIHASGAFVIEWRPGAPACSVTVDENLVRYIRTSTKDGKLTIRSRKNLRPTDKIRVVVSSRELVGARLSGACKLTAEQIATKTFALDTSGACNVTVAGTADELLADMTGASRLRADSLRAKIVDMSTTGASNAEVFASEKLSARITGAGKVTYSGNPPTVERQVTGAGKISKRD